MAIEEEIEKTRRKTKRAPDLTWEEVNELLEELGIKDLYDNAINLIDELDFIDNKHTTRSGVSFDIYKEGVGRRTLFTIPVRGKNITEEGLAVCVIRIRLEDMLGVDITKLELGEDIVLDYGVYYFRFILKTGNDIGKLFDFLAEKVRRWLSKS